MADLIRTTLAVLALATAWARGGDVVLDNGARLVLRPVPGVGAVSVIAVYRTGYADDPAGLAQAAHLAEHLRCTAGAGDDGPNEAFARLNSLGMANAETLASMTYYDYALPAGSADAALGAEHARLTALRITDADVERETPRMAVEVRGVGLSPGLFVGKFALMAATQAWRHGADRVAIAAPVEPEAAAMRAFIDARHRVDGLTVVVSGAFDAGAAEARFRSLFGPLAAPAGPEVEHHDFAEIPAFARVAWDVPARVVLVAMPGDAGGCEAELAALATSATLAFGGERGVRSTVRSGPGVEIGALPLLVGACLLPGKDEDSVLEAIHRALDRAATRTPDRVRAMTARVNPTLPALEPERVRSLGRSMAEARGWPEHVGAAVVMGNAALAELMRPAADGCDDAVLAERIRTLLARDNRRVLILDPE